MAFRLLLISNFLVLIACSSAQVNSARHIANDNVSFDQAIEMQQKLNLNERDWVSSDIHQSQLLHHGSTSGKSILIIHGLHESPYYMQPFTEYFYNRGYNVHSILLPGHLSRDPNALNDVRYSDWVAAAEQGFEVARGLGQEVEILGYSLGGELAVYLALAHPESVKKLYLISPALALSDKVFLSSLFLGWTGFNANKVCHSPDAKNYICRAAKYSDNQIKPMLKDGLNPTPAAGFQVQRLIDFVLAKFGKTDALGSASEENYYAKLMEVYNQLTIPIFLAGTANDNVINQKFNEDFINQYAGHKSVVTFPKSTGITHISITKPQGRGFRQSPEIFNPEFATITSELEKL